MVRVGDAVNAIRCAETWVDGPGGTKQPPHASPLGVIDATAASAPIDAKSWIARRPTAHRPMRRRISESPIISPIAPKIRPSDDPSVEAALQPPPPPLPPPAPGQPPPPPGNPPPLGPSQTGEMPGQSTSMVYVGQT